MKKRMKRHLLFAILCSMLICKIFVQAAQPRWNATLKFVLGQDYFTDEGIYCFVEIVGHTNATSIQNVDITLSKQVGNDWVEVESWLDLVGTGNEFIRDFMASTATVGYIYRLHVTADVYYDNTYETIESYMDKEY